ncbi:MAG TPA: FAD-dependent oxidoreductase, partial [Acidimicrobiales bacterium]
MSGTLEPTGTTGPTGPVVAVVGAGMAGLSAAWELVQKRDGGGTPRIVVLEAGSRPGGKVR